MTDLDLQRRLDRGDADPRPARSACSACCSGSSSVSRVTDARTAQQIGGLHRDPDHRGGRRRLLQRPGDIHDGAGDRRRPRGGRPHRGGARRSATGSSSARRSSPAWAEPGFNGRAVLDLPGVVERVPRRAADGVRAASTGCAPCSAPAAASRRRAGRRPRRTPGADRPSGARGRTFDAELVQVGGLRLADVLDHLRHLPSAATRAEPELGPRARFAAAVERRPRPPRAAPPAASARRARAAPVLGLCGRARAPRTRSRCRRDSRSTTSSSTDGAARRRRPWRSFATGA